MSKPWPKCISTRCDKPAQHRITDEDGDEYVVCGHHMVEREEILRAVGIKFSTTALRTP